MRRLLCLALLVAAATTCAAQLRPYRFIHADSLVVRKLADEYVTNLYGDVHFFYGETEFFADHAELFDQQEIARLVGRVQVFDDTLDLFADSVSYDRRLERLDLVGNVRAERDTLSLTGNQAVYLRERGRLDLEGDVFFRESHADGTIRTLSCETAVYFRDPESLTTDGRVRAWDERENFRGRCGHAEYHITDGYAWMIQNPELESAGEDSLYIRAEKIEWFEEAGRLVANFDVVTRSEDYHTSSDFLIYLTEEDEAVFLGKPTFHTDQADGAADEFHLYFDEHKIDRATFQDSCEVFFRTGSDSPKSNRVTADWMEFGFQERKLRRFVAEGNVESLFEQQADEERDFSGNHATGTRMTVLIDEDESIESVRMTGGVSGKYSFESQRD
ncbi:MAG: hypothetical protein K8R90_03805 [Candidatus Cloacimonetes bacterium]|nr:hypothetical protein [Candidatus Cloacimonadota bacterium]